MKKIKKVSVGVVLFVREKIENNHRKDKAKKCDTHKQVTPKVQNIVQPLHTNR